MEIFVNCGFFLWLKREDSRKNFQYQFNQKHQDFIGDNGRNWVLSVNSNIEFSSWYLLPKPYLQMKT